MFIVILDLPFTSVDALISLLEVSYSQSVAIASVVRIEVDIGGKFEAIFKRPDHVRI